MIINDENEHAAGDDATGSDHAAGEDNYAAAASHHADSHQRQASAMIAGATGGQE